MDQTSTGPRAPHPLPAPFSAEALVDALETKAKTHDQKFFNHLLRLLVYRYAEAERKVSTLNVELRKRQNQLEQDLIAAGHIQRSLIPKKQVVQSNFSCHWSFIPSEKVAGDIFNVFPLTAEKMAFYIIDVTGHGVPAAMVTASISQFLNPYHAIPGAEISTTDCLSSPIKALLALEEQFPQERFNKLFSIIYGVVDLGDRMVTLANAGHPYPVIFGDGRPPRFFEESCPLVGMGAQEFFGESRISLPPGGKILLYSDGVTECRGCDKTLFGEPRLLDLLERHADAAPADIIRTLEQELKTFNGEGRFGDDVTFFVISLPG